MDTDFTGLFGDFINLWQLMGPKGHAAVALGLLIGWWSYHADLWKAKQDRQDLAQEIANRTGHSQQPAPLAPENNPWRIPALEKKE